MKRAAVTLAALLAYAILTLGVAERWAWSLFQLGVFLLAGWRILRPQPWRVGPSLLPLAAASAWPLLQLIAGTTLCRGETWIAALDWVTFLAVFALAQDLFSDCDRARLLQAASVFGVLVAAEATLQLYSSGGKIFWLFASGYTEGVLGPFVNRGQYSAWIELLLPVSMYLALSDRRHRLFFGLASAIMFASVIAGASRAGFALACGELLATVALAAARKLAPRKTLLLAAAQIAVLAAIAVAFAGWQGLESRFEARGTEALRGDALRASVQMVRDRPWTGSGIGTWPAMYPAYAGFDSGLFMNQAHNDWAQWAAEGGLPFAFFLAAFAALSCKPAIRSIYGLGIVAFLLHALVDYPMQQRPGIAVWFFAVAGATAAWKGYRTRSL